MSEHSRQIGFIGLGQLGFPIASNLITSGYDVRVYNRTASKADPLIDAGAARAERPIDAVTPGGIVATLLWDDASVEDVVRGEGFLERLGDGVHISMTTILPETSRRLAALHAECGAQFVEAPVFGRPEAAAARQLWMPMAGPAEAKARVRPVLEAMGAREVFDLGEDAGAATMTKLVGNFLIISATRSLNEGIEMARASGVDPVPLVDMLTQTLFAAPVYQSYGKALAAGAAPMGQSAIPRKDIGLFVRTAEAAHADTTISRVLLQLLEAMKPAV